MRWTTAGCALLAFAAAASPRVPASACNVLESSDWDGEGVEDEISVFGAVTEVDGLGFRIGDAKFVLPPSPSDLPWCGPPNWEIVKYDRLKVGDVIAAGGSLRPDGTVLAYFATADGSDISEGTDLVDAYATGVVESTSGGSRSANGLFTPFSFVVGGVAHFFDLSDRHATRPVWSNSTWDYWGAGGAPAPDGGVVPISTLAPGDAVMVTYVVDRWGTRTATDTFVRQSGKGTRLAGTVTSVYWNEGPVGFGDLVTAFLVDGIPVMFEGYTDLHRHNPQVVDGWILDDQFWSPLGGEQVAIIGTLRGGVVFCDRLDVVREPMSSAKRSSGRHRLGRLRANGVIESASADGTICVSGLDVAVRAPRTKRGRTPAVGQRVRVDAVVRDGRVTASRVRPR